MKRRIFLFLLAFVAGFLTHALIFPDFLANGLTDVSQIVIPNPTPTPNSGSARELVTKIAYDGEHFNRHNISIEVGTYLTITNQSSTQLMSLVSNNPLLTTPRGYGEAESLQAKMDERGQFLVVDKNNASERLVITVK